jgi:hypothetical protein
MTPSAHNFRTPSPSESMISKLLLAWVVSLLLLGSVNVAGAASYDALPGWLLLLEVSWALVQVAGLLRLIYCL